MDGRNLAVGLGESLYQRSVSFFDWLSFDLLMGEKRDIVNAKRYLLGKRIGLVGDDKPVERGGIGRGRDAEHQSCLQCGRARVGDLYFHEIGDVVRVSRVQRVEIIEDETARLRTRRSYGRQGST